MKKAEKWSAASQVEQGFLKFEHLFDCIFFWSDCSLYTWVISVIVYVLFCLYRMSAGWMGVWCNLRVWILFMMFLWWVVYMFAVCLHAVKHFMEKKQPTLKWLLYFNIWIEQEKKGTWLRMGKTKYLSLKYKDCHKESLIVTNLVEAVYMYSMPLLDLKM